MKSTDLLNPGDFHQVTHQIRELVAYAISQLETAKDDGSLPSGRFANFLIDAAKKTPGFTEGVTGLADNQHLLEDGNVVSVEGFDVQIEVKGSQITGAVLKDPAAHIVRDAAPVTLTVGADSVDCTLTLVDGARPVVKPTAATVAIVSEGQELPVHDQGGHAGVVVGKVTANKVVDIVFATPGAHILRAGDKYQIGRAGGAAEVIATITADKTVTFALADPDHSILARGSSVFLGKNPEAVGVFSAPLNDGSLRIGAAGWLTTRSNQPIKMVNVGDSQANYAEATPVHDGNDRVGHCVMRNDYMVLANQREFTSQDGTTFKPTIVSGRLVKLENI